MKKISFIIIGGAIALASCKNTPAVDPAKQQAHIDSVVNSFLDGKKAELQKMCDDNIMQAAQDSAKMILEKEKKGMHHVSQAPVKKSTPATVGNGKPSMTGGTSNSTIIGNGKPSMTAGAPGSKSNGTTVGNGKPKM